MRRAAEIKSEKCIKRPQCKYGLTCKFRQKEDFLTQNTSLRQLFDQKCCLDDSSRLKMTHLGTLELAVLAKVELLAVLKTKNMDCNKDLVWTD